MTGWREQRGPGLANQIAFPTQHHGAQLQRQPLRRGRAARVVTRKQAGEEPEQEKVLTLRKHLGAAASCF